MKIKYLFIIFFTCFFYILKAQQDSSYQKSKLIFSLDSHNSFIKGRKAPMMGPKMGIKVNRISAGLAGYTLTNPLSKQGTFENLAQKTIEGTVELHFGYFATWLEYFWINTYRWEFSTAYFLGIGSIEILYYPFDLSIIPPQKKSVAVTELYTSLSYRISRYFGCGVGAGYRNLLTINPFISKNFDSPLYNFRLKIYTSEIIKDIKGCINKKFKK